MVGGAAATKSNKTLRLKMDNAELNLHGEDSDQSESEDSGQTEFFSSLQAKWAELRNSDPATFRCNVQFSCKSQCNHVFCPFLSLLFHTSSCKFVRFQAVRNSNLKGSRKDLLVLPDFLGFLFHQNKKHTM